MREILRRYHPQDDDNGLSLYSMMTRSRVVRLIFGFLLLFFFALPRVFPLLARDFPSPTGFVNDYAGLFSSSFRDKLETDLYGFEKETTAEIAVVTVESLEGDSIEETAVQLFEQWGIGKKGEDNGLLILIAEQDRQMRIEVGYGLEPIITDGRAGRIIREQMRPAFKESNYERGVQLAVEEIKNYLRSGQPPTEEEEIKEKASSFLPLIIFGAILFIYLFSFLARSKRFWPGGVLGAIFGFVLGAIVGSLLFWVIGLGIFGLILDFILSKNYKKLKRKGKPTGFFKSWGGFSGGGGGGGFSGFGGGSSGGGGASSSW